MRERHRFYLLLEVEEIIGLINEEDLESTSPKIVPAEMYFPEFRQGQFEVMWLGVSITDWRAINKVDCSRRHLHSTFDLLHDCYQFTVFFHNELLITIQRVGVRTTLINKQANDSQALLA